MLLDSARDWEPSGVVLVGINQGRLGCMGDVPPAEIAGIFAAIFAGKYVREDRLMLEARVLREKRPQTFVAMNDVVIGRASCGNAGVSTCRSRWAPSQ